MDPSTTVLGAPLEPGERVIRFDKASYTADKIVLVVLGIIFLVVGVGLVIIGVAIFWDRWHPRGVVVTNRRLIAIDRNGVPTSVALSDIASLDPERVQSHSGGGLAGAIAEVAVDAIADHLANKNPKHEPAFWNRTVAIVVGTRAGAKVRVPTRRGPELGPFLVRLSEDPASVERLPSVAYEG